MLFACALLLLASLGWATVVPEMKHTGAKWIITRAGFNDMLEYLIIPVLESSVNDFTAPDMSGTVKTSVGKVEYFLGNIKMSNFKVDTNGVTLNPDRSTASISATINGSLYLDYSYAMQSFPYTSDEGSATIYFNDAFLQGEVGAGRSPNYMITVSLVSADVDISKFDIDIESDMAWLIDLILDIFRDEIVDSLNKLLVSTLETAVEQVLDLFLGWDYPMTNTDVGVLLDYRFTNDKGATVYDEWVTTEVTWYSVEYFKGYDHSDFSIFDSITEVKEFPDIYNGKLFQIIVSKQRVMEMANVQYSSDFFIKTFSKDGVNDKYFEPAFWGKTLDLSNYSDVTAWSYVFRLDGDIVMDILASAIRISTNMHITFKDQNGGERLQIVLPIYIVAQPFMGEGLTLTQDINSVRGMSIEKGNANIIGDDYEDVEELLHNVFFPYANSLLSKGGFQYKCDVLPSEMFTEDQQTYEIVADSLDEDGYLVYSMEPSIHV